MKTEWIDKEKERNKLKESIIYELGLYAFYLSERRAKFIEFKTKNVSVRIDQTIHVTLEDAYFFEKNDEQIKPHKLDLTYLLQEMSKLEDSAAELRTLLILFSFLNQIYEDMAFKPIDASSMIFIDDDDKRTIN
jgi:hypothetical protein